jgi:hypothetical protein
LTGSEKVEVKLSSTSSEGEGRRLRTPRMVILNDGASPGTVSSKRDLESTGRCGYEDIESSSGDEDLEGSKRTWRHHRFLTGVRRFNLCLLLFGTKKVGTWNAFLLIIATLLSITT